MTWDMVAMTKDECDMQKDVGKAQNTTENDIKMTITLINDFLDPFAIEDEGHLHCISLREPVPNDVAAALI